MLEWPNGLALAKRQKYQLMNCQSKPLLSLMKCGRGLAVSWTHCAKLSITVLGSSKVSVFSRVNPLIARAS